MDKKNELETKVEDKLAKKKEQNKISKSMRAREKNLLNLNISIRVSVDGDTQEAKVGAVQGWFLYLNNCFHYSIVLLILYFVYVTYVGHCFDTIFILFM